MQEACAGHALRGESQCVINYSASKLAKKMSKAEERTYKLTQEQYEEVQLYSP
jgi:hypothetical protein